MVPLFCTLFQAIWLVQTGQLGELRWQLDRAVRARRNGIRIAGMLDWAEIKFSPRNADYWEAFAVVVTEAAARGLYVECAFFCDAQRIVPDKAERERWIDVFATFCNAYPTIWAQIANEPMKNGWSDADDPDILSLGRLVKWIAPGTILSIGDPVDTTGYSEKQKTIATVADYLVLHPSRAGNVSKDQFRRWLDHLKGFSEGRGEWPGKALLIDEPMGAAAIRTGSRDNSVAAHVAAAVNGCMVGGYTYLHRPEQDDTAPGLIESGLAAEIPGSPDYQCINATLVGSPVAKFSTWNKIRTISNGSQGWIVAHGQRAGTMVMREGWTEELVYTLTDDLPPEQGGGCVGVWTASR